MNEEKVHIDTVIGSVFGNTEIHNYFEQEVKNNSGIRTPDVKDAEYVEEEDSDTTQYVRPSFEEAIPEYLRTGKLLKAWIKLRDAGLLDKDYHLAKNVSKAAANYMVIGFCDGKQKKEWKPFEKFWGLTNLKVAKGQFSKKQSDIISRIFMNL